MRRLPIESPGAITGKIAHIDAHRIIVLTSAAQRNVLGEIDAIQTYTRDKVVALHRRPSSRLGAGFMVGAAAGAALGAWIGAELCDRQSIAGCGDNAYGDDGDSRRNLSKIVFSGLGAFTLWGMGHGADDGANGMDPSDWVKIDWSGETADHL